MFSKGKRAPKYRQRHRTRLAKGLIQRGGLTEIMYSQHIERDGKHLLQEMCEKNLEGIVAKRTGVYAEHGWLKIKNPN